MERRKVAADVWNSLVWRMGMVQQRTAAIIGCGRMAGSIDDEVRDHPAVIFPYSHAGTYQICPRTTLVAAAEIVDDRRNAFLARWEIPRGYRDYREMIERERPEIISVTTRPGSHREIVVFAAEHGVKGIWCEKPLCCSLAEADAMVEACESNGTKLNLGVNRRYGPLYREIRRLLVDGIVGDVQAVICHGGSSALWGHSHASDLMLLLAGDPSVAFVQGTVDADVADYADNRVESDPLIQSAFVQFGNGVRGYFLATIGYDWEITGSAGKLRALSDGSAIELRQPVGRWKQLEPTDAPPLPNGSSALACLEDLVEAVETGRETKGNIQLARRSQEIMMGIIASHGQNGARVPLPLANRSLYVGKRDW
jgi:predicted dehydrogenase